jgi:hypothetical protein
MVWARPQQRQDGLVQRVAVPQSDAAAYLEHQTFGLGVQPARLIRNDAVYHLLLMEHFA